MHDLDLALQEMENDDERADTYDPELDEMPQDLDELDGRLTDAEELEFAAELLEVTSDGELDQFFGKLFRKITKSVTKGPLGGILKSVAKKALPMIGTAAGTFFGGPVGASIGANAGKTAAKLFGLELEGLSVEDQEFEVARRVVRLAAGAAKQLGTGSPAADPVQAAKSAVLAAAAEHAPGLSAAVRGAGTPAVRGVQSGRWIRRGRTIVLLGT